MAILAVGCDARRPAAEVPIESTTPAPPSIAVPAPPLAPPPVVASVPPAPLTFGSSSSPVALSTLPGYERATRPKAIRNVLQRAIVLASTPLLDAAGKTRRLLGAAEILSVYEPIGALATPPDMILVGNGAAEGFAAVDDLSIMANPLGLTFQGAEGAFYGYATAEQAAADEPATAVTRLAAQRTSLLRADPILEVRSLPEARLYKISVLAPRQEPGAPALAADQAAAAERLRDEARTVLLAIAFDRTSSMTNVIAESKRVVAATMGELRSGVRLRVAIVAYADTPCEPEVKAFEVIADFTDEPAALAAALDRVAVATTSSGDWAEALREGLVQAGTQLSWSKYPKAARLLWVVADQGGRKAITVDQVLKALPDTPIVSTYVRGSNVAMVENSRAEAARHEPGSPKRRASERVTSFLQAEVDESRRQLAELATLSGGKALELTSPRELAEQMTSLVGSANREVNAEYERTVKAISAAPSPPAADAAPTARSAWELLRRLNAEEIALLRRAQAGDGRTEHALVWVKVPRAAAEVRPVELVTRGQLGQALQDLIMARSQIGVTTDGGAGEITGVARDLASVVRRLTGELGLPLTREVVSVGLANVTDVGALAEYLDLLIANLQQTLRVADQANFDIAGVRYVWIDSWSVFKNTPNAAAMAASVSAGELQNKGGVR